MLIIILTLCKGSELVRILRLFHRAWVKFSANYDADQDRIIADRRTQNICTFMQTSTYDHGLSQLFTLSALPL